MKLVMYLDILCLKSLQSLSEHPRWSLVEDGQAISKYLMMRNDKRKKSKSEHSKNMLGELLVLLMVAQKQYILHSHQVSKIL